MERQATRLDQPGFVVDAIREVYNESQ